MERQENAIETVDIEEKEADWICPTRRAEKILPGDSQKFMEDRAGGDLFHQRLMKIPDSDLFLIYISNKIYLFNKSNMHLVTAPGGDDDVLLSERDFGVVEYTVEIKLVKISGNEKFLCVLLVDNTLQVMKLENLIQNKELKKEIFTTVENMLKETESIVDIAVLNDGRHFLLQNANDQLSLYSLEEKKLLFQTPGNKKFEQFYIHKQILISGEGSELNFYTIPPRISQFEGLALQKNFDLKHLLSDEENEYSVSYITTVGDQFLCIGAIQKPKDASWDDFSNFVQNFYFFNFIISENNSITINKVFKSEYVLFIADEYEFKKRPKYQSVFYTEYDLFILSSTQYHMCEMFFLEDDFDSEVPNAKVIFRGTFEDDQKIVMHKDHGRDRMTVCAGISIVDYKHEGYVEEKIMLTSEENYSPPLVFLLSNTGRILTYYLTNKRDESCVLKEVKSNIMNVKGKVVKIEQIKQNNNFSVSGKVNMNVMLNNNLANVSSSSMIPQSKPQENKSAENNQNNSFSIFKDNEGFNNPAIAKIKPEIPNINELKLEDSAAAEEREKKAKLEEEERKIKEAEELQLQKERELEEIKLRKEREAEELRLKKIKEEEDRKQREKEERERIQREIEEEKRRQREKEERIKKNFERLMDKLNHTLKWYKNFLSTCSSDLEENLKKLESALKEKSVDKHEKEVIELSESVIKENKIINENVPKKSDLLAYHDAIASIVEKKEILEKLISNAEKYYNEEDVENMILALNSKDLIEIKNKVKTKVPILQNQVDEAKIFLSEIKKFQENFSEMSEINRQLQYYNKYQGAFKKFKPSGLGDKKGFSGNGKEHNVSDFESVNQNKIYNTVMSKYEEVFLDLEYKFNKVLLPKFEKIKYLMSHLDVKSGGGGFSISQGEVKNIYNHAKEDITYLGNNPLENPILYKELDKKLENIFVNLKPTVTYYEPRKKMKLDEFLLSGRKDRGVKQMNVRNDQEKVEEICSNEYLENMLSKIKHKIEGREKVEKEMNLRKEIEINKKVVNRNEQESKAVQPSVKVATTGLGGVKTGSLNIINFQQKNEEKPVEAKPFETKAIPVKVVEPPKEQAKTMNIPTFKPAEKKEEPEGGTFGRGFSFAPNEQDNAKKENQTEKNVIKHNTQVIPGEKENKNENKAFGGLNGNKSGIIGGMFGNKTEGLFGAQEGSKDQEKKVGPFTFPSTKEEFKPKSEFNKDKPAVENNNGGILSNNIVNNTTDSNGGNKQAESKQEEKKPTISFTQPKIENKPAEVKLSTNTQPVESKPEDKPNVLNFNSPFNLSNMQISKPEDKTQATNNNIVTKPEENKPKEDVKNETAPPMIKNANPFNSINVNNNFFKQGGNSSTTGGVFSGSNTTGGFTMNSSNLNNTINNPSLNLQNTVLPSNTSNAMPKPSFGAKPSLGMSNPLQSGYGNLGMTGNTTNSNTSSAFTGFSATKSTGFSNFANPTNQSGFFNVNTNQNQNQGNNPFIKQNGSEAVMNNTQNSGLNNTMNNPLNNTGFFGQSQGNKPTQNTGFSNFQGQGGNTGFLNQQNQGGFNNTQNQGGFFNQNQNQGFNNINNNNNQNQLNMQNPPKPSGKQGQNYDFFN